MIKIGLTGVHASGKTTKTIDLMEHYTFLGNRVLVVDEVARSCPYTLSPPHTLRTIEAQEWLWSEQMAAEKYAMTCDVDVIICDRTVMDNLMYYHLILDDLFGADAQTSYQERWQDLYRDAQDWMPTYNQVIRLPLNLEYLKADDPIRPKDVNYAKRIDRLFDRFVDKYVTGSPNRRDEGSTAGCLALQSGEEVTLQCDHCPRTATGTEIELLDAGWARITISAPIRRTFTACPDHSKDMTRAAFEAIKATSPRHVEVL